MQLFRSLMISQISKPRDETTDAEDNIESTLPRKRLLRALRCVIPALLLLLALLATALVGICTASTRALIAASIAIILCGALAVVHTFLKEYIAQSSVLRPLISPIALIAAASFGFASIELPWNSDLFTMSPAFVCLNIVLVLLLVTALWLIGQRRFVLPFFGLCLCGFFGIVQHFVLEFRGTVLLPIDILSMATALSVSGGYTYAIDSSLLKGLMCWCVASHILLFACYPCANKDSRKSIYISNVLTGCVCLLILGVVVTVPDYKNDYNVDSFGWNSTYVYTRCGFTVSFISALQTMSSDLLATPPTDYSDNEADALLESYVRNYTENSTNNELLALRQEQFLEEEPTVIVVMNESFVDLSAIYGDLDADYEGPSFYTDGIQDVIMRGVLGVSNYGGGTCNSEFSFLTGNSLALIGSGNYPYQLYSFSNCESLVSQFSQLGYTTTAIHPHLASNWRRDQVYEELGFDNFYSFTSFEDADTLRGMVTDEATYDKILELLEEDDSPQFIFNVTIQNHSGYNSGLIDESDQLNYQSTSVDDEEATEALNEYLACIEASDDALEAFLAKLEQLDRPIVVLFFGDHQPEFADVYNDALFTDEDSMEHTMRLYESTYLIWANYDIVGIDDETTWQDMSVCYLGATLLETIGAPLTDYQKSQLVLLQTLPQITAYGYQTTDGVWHNPSNEETVLDTYSDFLFLEYRKLKAELLGYSRW